jgi:hypothetical protein
MYTIINIHVHSYNMTDLRGRAGRNVPGQAWYQSFSRYGELAGVFAALSAVMPFGPSFEEA